MSPVIRRGSGRSLAAAILALLAVLAPPLAGPPRIARAAAAVPLYLAEGSTRPGFQEYLALENAGAAAAPVTLAYEFADGSPPLVQALSLPAGSRTTVDVNQAVGAGRDVSVKIDPGGDPDIHAERPLYFNACLPVCVNGSHVAPAVPARTSWYFAEGYTGLGFQEYIALLNPNPQPALVGITYAYVDGSTAVWTVSLPPTSRYTVDVNQFVGGIQQVSARVESALPIVAERPLYFNG